MDFDGGPVDMATIGLGVLGAGVGLVVRRQTRSGPCFQRSHIISDMLNGASLAPFLWMIGSVFSSKLLDQLMSASKVSIGLGGMIGTIYVIGELLKDGNQP